MSQSHSSNGTANSQGVVVNSPTDSNTWASAACVLLDFLAFTVPADLVAGKDVAKVLDVLLLSVPLLEDRQCGFLGWRQSYYLCEGGILAMGGQRDTVYVSLSGGALGYFSNEGLDVFGWVSYLLDLGVVIKRVDLAFDDHDMLINLAKVRRAVRDGSCVTHARSSREVRDLQGGHGWTIYIGSRTSPTMVRIYDKAAEQQVGRWWVRVEVEYKRERAHQVVLAWRDAGFSVLAGVGFLRGSVDFRVNDGTATKSRWALADWWAKFVGQVKARRVRVPLPDRTIEDVARWLHKSVAGALAAFTEVYGDGALRRLVHRGDRIMSRSHRRLVMAAI